VESDEGRQELLLKIALEKLHIFNPKGFAGFSLAEAYLQIGEQTSESRAGTCIAGLFFCAVRHKTGSEFFGNTKPKRTTMESPRLQRFL
jgi:hypothetical protein